VLLLAGLTITRPAVWRCRTSYLFLLPTFLALILFSYYPILSAFSHAFTEWRGNGDSAWTGFANFRELFGDDVMRASVRNTVILLLAQAFITLTVPLAVAEAIFALRSLRSQYVYRVLFVIPMVVPGIVILLVWGFFFDYNLGPLNNALEALGLASWKQAWLGDPRLSLYSLIGIGFPWVGGFALLVYYAGLQNISTEVLDSARVDGARGLTRFRFIDLPLLLGQTRLLLVLAFIDGVQGFQTQLLLTNGGPSYSTMVPGLHMYQTAMTFDRMGYACAIGVVLFLVCLGLTYVNLNTFRASSEYQP
jgi:ABC-type sugar transport system permease subunit